MLLISGYALFLMCFEGFGYYTRISQAHDRIPWSYKALTTEVSKTRKSSDDRIEVKFILNDPQKTNIHIEIRILNSANGQYGGEFLNLTNEILCVFTTCRLGQI